MKAGSDHCNNWDSADIEPKGRFGYMTATNTDWTEVSDADINPTNCSNSFHLYCFQNTP